MAEWRVGRGWTDEELGRRLDALHGLERNFSDALDEMTLERGWHHYSSEAVIGSEAPGEPQPNGPFERGCAAVASYAFSDPTIVVAHFDPDVPLLGRRLLLEMRALRVLHYLGGVVIGATRHDQTADATVFGFRYDTLEGHIEEGAEWFLLTKDHATGAIRFRIEAAWRPGAFPNWWSRLGFALAGTYYQERWHRRAHRRLADLIRHGEQLPDGSDDRQAHPWPDVIFERTKAHYE